MMMLWLEYIYIYNSLFIPQIFNAQDTRDAQFLTAYTKHIFVKQSHHDPIFQLHAPHHHQKLPPQNKHKHFETHLL